MYQTQIRELFAKSKYLYDLMLKDGVAKECARFVFTSSHSTRLYMSGSVRSLDSLHRNYEVLMVHKKNTWI